ncbi:MAG: MBOAT family protein [Flexilinea sp.]
MYNYKSISISDVCWLKHKNMQFTSFAFLFFFSIVCLVYFVIPKKLQWIWLLAASYFFYCSWNTGYVLLLILSTLVTWISGIFLSRANLIENEMRCTSCKKLIVTAGIILSIGILFIFKYSNFTIYNLNRIMKIANLPAVGFSFDWIIPVGISFYILQALTYTIDSYRGKIFPENNFFKYALFVSFFPQILSGPIGRARDMLPQINKGSSFDFDRVKNGLWLMLWGYFQKMVLGDRLALFVNTVFDDPVVFQHGGILNLLAMVFFGLQIYCDFAGYSNIAIGAAQVLGYSIPNNFLRPYFAKSVIEFWKRWHISLTSWFRDYLYIPLGGNRVGIIRHFANILIVFLISGLWHGANWTFLIWGFLNGLYQLVEILFRPAGETIIRKLRVDIDTFGWKIVRAAAVFFLTDFAWIFFRSNTVHDAFGFIRGLFYFNPQVFLDGRIFQYGLDRMNMQITLSALVVLLFVSWMQRSGSLREKINRRPLWLRWLVILAGIYAILFFGIYGPNIDTTQFIYTRF